MADQSTNYIRAIHKKFNFYAAWPPNQPRRLGDVGVLLGGQFQRVTTLKNLAISFKKRIGPQGSDISHSSGSTIAVEMNAKANTLPGTSIPKATADVSVSFSASGSFVFQAEAPQVKEIEDIVKLEADILGLYRSIKGGKRRWNKDWCVITELMTANKVTVLISNSNSSKLKLSADGLIPGSPAPLASATGGLSVVHREGEITAVLAESDLTPLFRVVRVRRSVLDWILGGDQSAAVGRAAPGSQVSSVPKRIFEKVPLDDALQRPAPSAKKKEALGSRKAVRSRGRNKITRTQRATQRKNRSASRRKRAHQGRSPRT